MIARFAAALAAVALLLGGALPAQAAPSDSVLVSTDGVTFSARLPGGVFGTGFMIPGAHQSTTLYVKNDSSVTAALLVSAIEVRASSREFADSLTLQVTSRRAPSGVAVPLGGVTGCATLLVEQLAPGAVTVLTVTLAMVDVAGQVAQGQTVAANLGLALQQSDAALAPVTDCQLQGIQLPVLALPDAATPEPHGNGILYPALMTIGALVGGGAFFLVAWRRRRRREQ
jgi:hypothetical protein